MFSDKVKLRGVAITQGTDGYPTETNTDTEVWVNRKSATRAEFYQSQAAGINVSMVYEVHPEDWNNQSHVVDGTVVYRIVRAYQRGQGVYELVCEEV